MEIGSLNRQFGVKLAAGVSCGPGTLINVDSNGEGVLASDTSSLAANGFSTVSGAGTKTTGMGQYVDLRRTGIIKNIDYATLTQGAKAYMTDTGRYGTAAPGTLNQVVGLALDDSSVFVDLDCQQV